MSDERSVSTARGPRELSGFSHVNQTFASASPSYVPNRVGEEYPRGALPFVLVFPLQEIAEGPLFLSSLASMQSTHRRVFLLSWLMRDPARFRTPLLDSTLFDRVVRERYADRIKRLKREAIWTITSASDDFYNGQDAEELGGIDPAFLSSFGGSDVDGNADDSDFQVQPLSSSGYGGDQSSGESHPVGKKASGGSKHDGDLPTRPAEATDRAKSAGKQAGGGFAMADEQGEDSGSADIVDAARLQPKPRRMNVDEPEWDHAGDYIVMPAWQARQYAIISHCIEGMMVQVVRKRNSRTSSF